MNERIKIIRKTLKMSQDVFAERIGMKGSSISLLESGSRNITEQVIRLICREFNVNYTWLVEGDGDMFLNIPDTLIDEIALEYKLDDEARIMVKEFLELSQENKKGVCTYIRNIVFAFNNEKK
jgi:transcriptional regulator with XRE-family HTH domain